MPSASRRRWHSMHPLPLLVCAATYVQAQLQGGSGSLLDTARLQRAHCYYACRCGSDGIYSAHFASCVSESERHVNASESVLCPAAEGLDCAVHLPATTCSACPEAQAVHCPAAGLDHAVDGAQRSRRHVLDSSRSAEAEGEDGETVQQLRAWVAQSLARPLPDGCDGTMPERTALVTYTNGHHFDLLVSQRNIAADAGLNCLLERVTTLCLDDACSTLCAENGIRCHRYRAFDIGAADTRKQVGYRTITWIKWLILHSIIPTVDAALFFDDDVTFFKDPLPLMVPPPFGKGPAVDFRHQTESGEGCSAAVNGGLLYVRNTPPGRQLLANMVARRADIEASGDKLDQDYVVQAARDAGASRCALPKRYFVGHCPRAQHGAARVGDVVSYHAHCCAVKASKQALVRRMVVAIGGGFHPLGEEPNPRLRDVDRLPLPGYTAWNDTCFKPRFGDAGRAWAALDVALQTPWDGDVVRGDASAAAHRTEMQRPAGRRSGDVLHR